MKSVTDSRELNGVTSSTERMTMPFLLAGLIWRGDAAGGSVAVPVRGEGGAAEARRVASGDDAAVSVDAAAAGDAEVVAGDADG